MAVRMQVSVFSHAIHLNIGALQTWENMQRLCVEWVCFCVCVCVCVRVCVFVRARGNTHNCLHLHAQLLAFKLMTGRCFIL